MADAPAVDRPHASATIRRPLARPSEASFVARPLQAKPSPAPMIVTVAIGRHNQLTMYGSIVRSPRPTSTSVRVRLFVCVVVRSGAQSAVPMTPTTIAAIARCSRRPARSLSRRSPTSRSTSSPQASAGCTTTSGASSSATTCRGKPRTESAVPGQPARAPGELTDEAHAQVVPGVHLARVECLQSDP